jgi:hypothetical protein
LADTPLPEGYNLIKLVSKLMKEALFLRMITGRPNIHTFTVSVIALKVLCLPIKQKKRVSQQLSISLEKVAMLIITAFQE